MPAFKFDNRYARELPQAGVRWSPEAPPAPRLLFFNEALAEALGADLPALRGEAGAAALSGAAVPERAEPLAQAYAGHQFGGFSPQLGDGRALLLGEVIDRTGHRRDIALKGSGRTPFSRGGDGKAAVGPMLREVLFGESMHALGIPTTRALAVVATGETIHRDRPLPGAVLTRVAASHLRVGSFQYFAVRGDLDTLRALVDHALSRHHPAGLEEADRPMALLREVARRQAALLAQWMHAGFIHGVMNTDNMTISGETIDYGPCAFLEAYSPDAVFSSIDHHGRYAYGNQPRIARWNLARFAEALLPLMVQGEGAAAEQAAVARAMTVIDDFPAQYEAASRRGARAKLGLAAMPADAADDAAEAERAQAWLALLHAHHVDFTLAWRHLADAAEGHEAPLRALFTQSEAPGPWLADWQARLARDQAEGGPAPAERAAAMRRVSPWIIPRHQPVEHALTAASEQGDLEPFERLLAALRRPYDARPEDAAYAEPAPPALTAAYQTFCGT